MEFRLPLYLDAINLDGSHAVFHPFARLPIELRRKIWILYLTNTESTLQIYRFGLRYPERVYYSNSTRRIHIYAGDQIFLEPYGCNIGQNNTSFLEPLRVSSAIRQIASATCVEARLAVLELFPDTLKFRHFPRGWMEVKGRKLIGSPDGAGIPEHILRFNKVKDIIVLHATWEDQKAAIEISRLRGSPPVDFAKICHVGVGVDNFRMYGMIARDYWGCASHNCRCQTVECQDHCKEDPLPGFLSLFPLLRTFYVTGLPSAGVHHPTGSLSGHDTQLRKRISCPCSTETQGHSWPMISVWGACGQFAIYDERSGCPFPKFDRIERIRERWHRNFPYYKALDHLSIKFIQLWDPDLLANPLLCRRCTRKL